MSRYLKVVKERVYKVSFPSSYMGEPVEILRSKSCKSCGMDFKFLIGNQKYCARCLPLINLNHNLKNKEFLKKFHKDNPNRVKEYSKHNIERKRKYRKLYSYNKYHNNLKFRLKTRISKLFRWTLTRYTKKGKIMLSRKYGLDYKEVMEHLIKTMPKDFNERKYHIDHIKPVSLFDLNNLEEVRNCFSKENLQWLEASENIRKSNHYIVN